MSDSENITDFNEANNDSIFDDDELIGKRANEELACYTIANLMNGKSFSCIDLDFARDITYVSHWANKEVKGIENVVDYFIKVFDDLKAKDMNIWAYVGTLEDGRPCVIEAVASKKNIVCVLIPSVKDAQIISIDTIDAKKINYKIDDDFEIANFTPIRDYVSKNKTEYVMIEPFENIPDDFPKENDSSTESYPDRLLQYYTKTENKIALKRIKELADKNNPDALRSLGMIYFSGINTDKQYNKAEEFLRRYLEIENNDVSYKVYLKILLERTNPFNDPNALYLFDNAVGNFHYPIYEIKDAENWKEIMILSFLMCFFMYDDLVVQVREEGRFYVQLKIGGILHNLIIRHNYQPQKTIFQRLIRKIYSSDDVESSTKIMSSDERDIQFVKSHKRVYFISISIKQEDKNHVSIFSDGIKKFNSDGSFVPAEEGNIDINKFFVGDRVPIHRLTSQGLKYYETSKYKFCFDPSPKTQSFGIMYHASLEVYRKDCDIPFIVFTAEQMRSRRTVYDTMICAFTNQSHLNFGLKKQESIEDNLLRVAKSYLKIKEELKIV